MTIRFGFTSKDEPFEEGESLGSDISIRDEGVDQGDVDTVDFVGAGVTASVSGGVATVSVNGTLLDIEDEGVPQGVASTLNVTGDGVSISVAAGTATLDIQDEKLTILTLTATKAAGSPYSVVSSGIGYTHSGDAGFLEITAGDFLDNKRIKIMPCGVEFEKQVDATWIDSQRFSLTTDLDSGDKILIYS